MYNIRMPFSFLGGTTLLVKDAMALKLCYFIFANLRSSLRWRRVGGGINKEIKRDCELYGKGGYDGVFPCELNELLEVLLH